MIHVTANNGMAGGARIVNPFDPADVAAMANTTSITVTIFGAGKVNILQGVCSRMAHYAYTFGYTVTVGAVTAKMQFRLTLDGLMPGTAHLWAVIAARLAGRQKIKADPLTTYARRSEIRKQLIKQWCPSVCDDGSDLRNATQDILEESEDYQQFILPLFAMYGLFQHGSIALPALV
jgi:hypothetical protein